MDEDRENLPDLELDEDNEFFGTELHGPHEGHELADIEKEWSSDVGDGEAFPELEGGSDLEGFEDPLTETEAFGLSLSEEPFAPTGGLDYQVIAPDTRRRILNTRREPWRHIVKLEPPGCTGTLIAPNKVLTAAHCVYSRKNGRPYSNIRAIPGKNGSGSSGKSEPFDSAKATRLDYPRRYASASSYAEAWAHDYAVITLDQPIGRKIGYWSRIASVPGSRLTKLRLNTAGYPADKGGQHLYWTYNKVISVQGPRIEYLLDTFGGQSGSPVWLRWKGVRTIVAVHVARDDAGSPGATPVVANRGLAITPSILAEIRSWVRS